MAKRRKAAKVKIIRRTVPVAMAAPRRRRVAKIVHRRGHRRAVSRANGKGLLVKLIAAAGIGYMENTSPESLESLTIGPLDASGVIGGGLWAANKFGLIKSPMAMDAAEGLLSVQAYKLGKAGFTTEGDWGK